MMKIGIDARFYGPVGKGLGRYVQEVVDNLIRICGTPPHSGEFQFVVFLSAENFDEFVCVRPEIKKVKLDFPWYGWREQVLLPFYIWREKLDLMHFPHFNVPLLAPGRFVVTIHDLILTNFPTVRATTRSRLAYRFKHAAYRLVIYTALRRAKRIISVSYFTKNDIIRQFKIAADKISVIYEGVADLAGGRDAAFIAKLVKREIFDQYHIPEKFLLYVGNAYPHKNLEFLLQAFKRLHLKRPDLKLVLVGRSDYFYERLKAQARSLGIWRENEASSAVVFPGYVPDAQLALLYRSAQLYVFPSLYEGFGLPPLEAMASGCPVLSSRRSSLPEILGAAAVYFNPEDEDDLLAKIEGCLDDEVKRQELSSQGFEQAKKYHWHDCASEHLSLYQSVLNSR